MKRFLVLATCLALSHGLIAESVATSADEILTRVENANGRRRDLLKRYTGSRQYRLQNARFGKEAAVGIQMKYREPEGERYTVLTQSGSDKLIGIINTVLASEARASVPPENARHQVSAALILVDHFGPGGLDRLVLGLNRVVTAAAQE